MAALGLIVKAGPPDFEYRIEVANDPDADWKQLAGSLVDSIEDISWLFKWGVYGKLHGHDWLQCNSCDELQMKAKGLGAPSQKPKCHMSPGCNGVYRRMPEIFEVTKPPKPRMTKKMREALEEAKKQAELNDAILDLNEDNSADWELADTDVA
jgi:hypothetical protein